MHLLIGQQARAGNNVAEGEGEKDLRISWRALALEGMVLTAASILRRVNLPSASRMRNAPALLHNVELNPYTTLIAHHDRLRIDIISCNGTRQR
jgi:hypothetical protein